MPVVSGSAFTTCGDVTARMRAILNDAAVSGGDIFTDDYAGMFPALNVAFENVYKQLVSSGYEPLFDYDWLIGIPAVTTVDPEARIIVTDTGCSLIYSNGIGDVNFTFATLGYNPPVIPSDLIAPLGLWERQTNTTSYLAPMKNSNRGLMQMSQQNALIDWEWGSYQSSDALIFRGALQVQDVKLQYERSLSEIAAVSDPLPIRGVGNAAAYELAKVLAAGRGGTIPESLAQEGQLEIELLKNISARRKQRKRVRRIPYSGRSRRAGFSYLT